MIGTKPGSITIPKRVFIKIYYSLRPLPAPQLQKMVLGWLKRSPAYGTGRAVNINSHTCIAKLGPSA
jgi:hypothetical protein